MDEEVSPWVPPNILIESLRKFEEEPVVTAQQHTRYVT